MVWKEAAAKIRSHRHVCAMPAADGSHFGGDQGSVRAGRVGEESSMLSLDGNATPKPHPAVVTNTDGKRTVASPGCGR